MPNTDILYSVKLSPYGSIMLKYKMLQNTDKMNCLIKEINV